MHLARADTERNPCGSLIFVQTGLRPAVRSGVQEGVGDARILGRRRLRLAAAVPVAFAALPALRAVIFAFTEHEDRDRSRATRELDRKVVCLLACLLPGRVSGATERFPALAERDHRWLVVADESRNGRIHVQAVLDREPVPVQTGHG